MWLPLSLLLPPAHRPDPPPLLPTPHPPCTQTCPQLQAELLQVIATAPPARSRAVHIVPHHQAGGQARAADESSTDGQLRRVRQRRE